RWRSSRSGAPGKGRRAGVACRAPVTPHGRSWEEPMSDTLQADVTPPPTQDERVGRRSRLARLFARPEAGALAGAIVIYIFFFAIAPPFRSANSLSTILYVSSTYGLMATPIALLMIGGEFDLSAGVAVTTAALTASLFAFEFTTNMWVGVVVALGIALLV